MEELKSLFNDREISMLIYALRFAIDDTERSVEFYNMCSSDHELLKESSDDLDVLRSLYRRFFPHLTDEELFGKGGAADEK